MAKNIYLGVDLGGTKIISCPIILNGSPQILGEAKNDAQAQAGVDKVIDRIVKTIEQSLEVSNIKLKKIKAVGLGVPGIVDTTKGEILLAPNLRWKNIPLRKIIEKRLGIPVTLDNDANLGALAEQRFGSARGVKNVVGVYWGTGIGGGIVVNGKIVRGYSFNAGEIGHMSLSRDGNTCGCGNHGCLETFSAKWALTEMLSAKIKNGSASVLKIEDLQGVVKSKVIKAAFAKNDTLVMFVIDQAIDHLGMAVANIVNLLNPEMIVLGGGMIESMEEELLPRIEAAARRRVMPFAQFKLRAAQLGDHSVLTGAAFIARQYSNQLEKAKV
jgi:glucokinase